MSHTNGETYLTVLEAAKYLNVSLSTVRRLITEPTKELAVTRIGRAVRISRSELDKYLASKTS